MSAKIHRWQCARWIGPLSALIAFTLVSPLLAANWESIGLSGSSVNAIAADPLDPATLYASAGIFHVYKSTDAGATWFEDDDGIPPYEAAQRFLAVSPNDPSTVLAAGDGGVTLSTDGGAHWTSVVQGLSCSPVYSFALDSATPGHVYVGTQWADLRTGRHCGGLFKLTLGSVAWQELTLPVQGYPGIIFVDESNPAVIYTANYSIDKSTDGGASWALFGDSLPGGLIMSSLAETPWDPTAIYTTTPEGLWRSDQNVANWLLVGPGPSDLQLLQLILDPARSGVLYAVAYDPATSIMHPVRSADGGRTWVPFDQGLPGGMIALNLTITPGADRLYAATDFGAYAMDLMPCFPDSQTLCLNNGRFQVRTSWTDYQGNTGAASVVPGVSSNDSGVMWFFGPNNWELLIKVLDGCGVNGHYWVYGAASTDVAYTIQVTDTQTGEIRTYTNPLGTSSPAITDTEAFGSCP